VDTRRRRLEKQLEGSSFKLDELTASKIEISRTQLAEWDASAR
jgi:hypothetical protein